RRMTDSTPTTISAAEAPATPSSVQAVAENWPDLLMALMHQQDLHEEQAAWAMDQIMSGKTPDVTMDGFLVAHHTQGETVEELAGLVSAMMDHGGRLPCLAVSVDIVGTGGGRAQTANISSIAALSSSGHSQLAV